jgi:putative PIN family toxin of toxin-antitoxin system
VRLVLDTNTAVSGLLWQGTPGQLIDAARSRQIEIFSSTPLLAELQGVLSRAKFAAQLAKRGLNVGDVFDGYAALVVIVIPAAIERIVVRDPADDQVLAAALAARADLIVSGDAHLLDLKSFRGIEIAAAAAAISRVGQTKS